MRPSSRCGAGHGPPRPDRRAHFPDPAPPRPKHRDTDNPATWPSWTDLRIEQLGFTLAATDGTDAGRPGR